VVYVVDIALPIFSAMFHSVACGRDHTIVATTSDDGPLEDKAVRILAMHRVREKKKKQNALLFVAMIVE